MFFDWIALVFLLMMGVGVFLDPAFFLVSGFLFCVSMMLRSN